MSVDSGKRALRAYRRVAIAGLALCLLAGASAFLTAAAAAAERTPLLMEGKNTLFQKVLMRPGAEISPEPGDAGALDTQAFSVHFVYGRETHDGEEWLEVGTDRGGSVIGWTPSRQTAAWDQALTVAFTNPAGRQLSLLFKSREGLNEALMSDDLLVQAETYREQIRRGTLPEDAPVVSIEPDTYVDISDQFYLLPIMESEEVYLNSGFPVNLLRVTSVSEQADEPKAGPEPKDAPPLRSAVTFVIDSTSSMGPYIDRVRKAIRSIYTRIEAEGMADRLRFGLVAFRDNVEKAPGLDYTSRLFSDPNDVEKADDFLSQVRDLEPASTSSQGFDEDAYSGVAEAISNIDWSNYAGRFVILITDAGAREGYDPLSGTGMSTEQIRQLARKHNAYVYSLHLLTPAGAGNHERAANQYRVVSMLEGAGAGRSLYYPVESGDIEMFGNTVERLSTQLLEQIKRAGDEDGRARQEAEVEQKKAAMEQAEDPEERAERELDYNTALLGLAIQLRYLGQRENERAPDVFDAWLTDRSFRNPDVPVLDVRVLLNKNQLSDLQETLSRILEASESGQIAPEDFFENLRAAAAAMGRAPSRIKEAETLAELDIIGEYLEGLPYRSHVMNVSQEVWTAWSVGQQQQFIDTLKSKQALYRRFHDDVDSWTLLNPNAPQGEAVYPVRLDALP